MKTILVFAIVLAVVGCASKGFNRGDLRKQIGVIAPEVTDKEIKEALAKKPNLPKPFKLAVYFKTPVQKGAEIPDWRWTEQDKNLMDDLANQLKSESIISEVFPLVGSVVSKEDLPSLRLVAAKHGADALLIIGGIADMDRYINKWGWTYILLAPAFFVPGSEADALFLSSASMWDVRNEYLYLTTEAEETLNKRYIAAFGKNDKYLFEEAKSLSLNKLKSQIIKMINGAKD